MSITKRFVCLANSRKPGGTCVAGRVLVDGKIGDWIRPVGFGISESIPEEHQRLQDGSFPQPLDVIDVPLLQPKGHTCQSENWLIDESRRWHKVGRMRTDDLGACTDNADLLWINGHHTRAGYHDEMPTALADQLSNSLALIKVPALRLRVRAPGEQFGNPERRVQGFFVYRGIRYGLRVTDLQVEAQYLRLPDGVYELGASWITISISEPFKKSNGSDCRYKLIAAVINV